MKLHQLHEKELQIQSGDWTFADQYDVIVLGLGTAGALALISAARQGLRVLGVEPHTYMGGVGTGGGIHYYHWGSEGGLQTEIDERCASYDKRYCATDTKSFHPDAKKYVLESMALEAGAEIEYNSVLCGVFVNEQRVCGLQILGPDGIKHVRSSFVIDASGDAHAAAMAGCAYRFGREADAYPQPYSFIRGSARVNGGITGDNFDAGFVDPRDPDDMSQACVSANSLHCFDQFNKDSALLYISSHFGLREGRFIVGEETVSFEDVIFERKRENLVMQSWSHHDNHCTDWSYESVLSQEWAVVADLFWRGQVADIPPGVFIPQGWDGLLVAGRCVSLDHDSHQGIRMQRDMQKFGEITGVIAALSIRHACMAKDVPIAELQSELMQSGCLAKPEQRLQHQAWLSDTQAIRDGLASTTPGEAIWSCRLLGDVIVEDLLNFMQDDDTLLRYHSAYALGLLRDKRCLPILHQMIRDNVTEIPYAFFYERKAAKFSPIFLAGLLADASSEAFLVECLHKITTDDISMSFVLVALLRVAEANPERREDMVQLLVAYLCEKQTEQQMVIWGNTDNPLNKNAYARIYVLRCAKRWGINVDMTINPTQRREQIMLANS